LRKNFRRRIRTFIIFGVLLIAIVLIIENSTKVLFPVKYKEYVYKYSIQNKVDPYLVFAIIKAESSFNPRAISTKNARGLMQISEKTGNWGAQSLKIEQFSVDRLYDPDVNIRIGCWYLNSLMKEFDNNLDLVIAAYNGGSGNVSEWLKDRNLSGSGNSLDRIPFKETEIYLKRVKNYYSIYKTLYN